MRAAFVLGLTLASSMSFATPPAATAPPPDGTKKAKPGEACKADADCDPNSRCAKGKCEARPTPPPPT